jgi:hypothetical protein
VYVLPIISGLFNFGLLNSIGFADTESYCQIYKESYHPTEQDLKICYEQNLFLVSLLISIIISVIVWLICRSLVYNPKDLGNTFQQSGNGEKRNV